jgi:hypothetical protein
MTAVKKQGRKILVQIPTLQFSGQFCPTGNPALVYNHRHGRIFNPACALSVTSMTDSIKAGWASSDSSDRINSFVLSPHVSRNVSKIALPE